MVHPFADDAQNFCVVHRFIVMVEAGRFNKNDFLLSCGVLSFETLNPDILRC